MCHREKYSFSGRSSCLLKEKEVNILMVLREAFCLGRLR